MAARSGSDEQDAVSFKPVLSAAAEQKLDEAVKTDPLAQDVYKAAVYSLGKKTLGVRSPDSPSDFVWKVPVLDIAPHIELTIPYHNDGIRRQKILTTLIFRFGEQYG
jgi:hypothetical protein